MRVPSVLGAMKLFAIMALLGAPSIVVAQGTNFGAPFLLQPLGAHAVGQGEATVADTSMGTESLWWNPAGLGRLRKREIAVHHSQTLVATSDMVAFAFPSKVLGTIGGSAYIVNLGNSENTGPNGEPLGEVSLNYYMLSASYASPVGKRLSVGLSAKYLMVRFVCSGCGSDKPPIEGNTSAFDLGAQYILPTTVPASLGVSIRNLGPALQTKDEQQSDPIPKILQMGGKVRLPIRSLQKNDVALDAVSDVIVSPAYSQPTVSFGVNLAYRQDVVLRGGFKSSSGNEGSTSGLSAGVGLRRGGLSFDLAREFNSVSAGLGTPPTFASLRITF